MLLSDNLFSHVREILSHLIYGKEGIAVLEDIKSRLLKWREINNENLDGDTRYVGLTNLKNSRIAYFAEGGGKTRVVAVVD